jgi:Fe2+ or Zn2+ uptake regulation protein
MLSEKSIIQRLSRSGFRITQPRRAVIRALLEDDGYASPAEILSRARTHWSSVGLVTVYRTLGLLSQLGFVRRIHTENGCNSFVVSSHGHRHHLICRRCGAAVEFEGCDLSAFLARVSQETGYLIEEHLLELEGLCSHCRQTA